MMLATEGVVGAVSAQQGAWGCKHIGEEGTDASLHTQGTTEHLELEEVGCVEVE